MEILAGDSIGLPLVTHIGTFSINNAQLAQSWHSHDGFELLFVLKGNTAWEFSNRQIVEVAGGHFLIVPPRLIHRARNGVRKPSQVCGLLFNPAARQASKNTTFTNQDLDELGTRLSEPVLTAHSFGRDLRSHLTRLGTLKRTHETGQRDPCLDSSLRTLACSIILDAARSLLVPASDSSVPFEAEVKGFLRQHIRQPVSMADLVRHMGFSRSHLFAMFRLMTGMSPNDFYVRLRIEKAQELLTTSTLPITTIALETGFSSSQYFSTVFRKHSGQTPAGYRKRAQYGRILNARSRLDLSARP